MIALAMLLAQKTLLQQAVLDIKAAYDHCKTYRDSGTQVTVYSEDGKAAKHTQRLKFATVFLRPGKLRFEFSEERFDGTWEMSKFWTTGKREMRTRPLGDMPSPSPKPELCWIAQGLTSFDGGKVETDTLDMIVAGFTGISGGTALTIPSFLFPEIVGLDYLREKDLRLLPPAQVSGHLCAVLETKTQAATLYFDAKTHLLLKITEHSDLGRIGTPPQHVTTLETTTYSPQIDGPVKVDEFKK